MQDSKGSIFYCFMQQTAGPVAEGEGEDLIAEILSVKILRKMPQCGH